jgi:predicted nuclease with TOPRIM domain
MPGENLLQTLQRYATLVQRLDDLATEQREFTKTVLSRLDRLEAHISDMRERLARLEASRNADRAEMQAEIARFKVEVERAELQLSRLLPSGEPKQPPSL